MVDIKLDYKEIKFGEASAEEELDKNPRFIMEGFYDVGGVLDTILNGTEFLVLGNKGSGKSILGEHLKSTAGLQNDESWRFVSKFSMKEFPFKTFAKITPGEGGVETKFPLAWQWALLVQVIMSFSEDAGKRCELDNHFDRAVDYLKSLGIIPKATLTDIVRISSQKNFKVKISQFEYSEEKAAPASPELVYVNVVAHLKKICENLQSPNTHFIVIDGLDDQLGERNHQLEAIASLISEAREINSFLRVNGVPCKVIVLCRKDIHGHLPGANKNKLKGYTINLDWYEDQVPVAKKSITQLINYRAKISGHDYDVFRKHFLPSYPGGKSPEEYLLDNTRYTPRDFVKLMSFIKIFKGVGAVTADQIDKSVKSYSADYFWPEIEDELDGYFTRSEIGVLKQALIHFHRREFLLSEFETFCRQQEYELGKLSEMFLILYDCGAVSNKLQDSEMFFSKMRDQKDFNERLLVNIHRGALKALALPSM